MTRATIRTLLRRQGQDVPSQEWSNAELNDIINLAYAKVMKEIVKVDPEAHLFWDTMDSTASTAWYPLPTATFGMVQVGIKSTASDTAFTKLKKKKYNDIKGNTGTTQAYCRRGTWIGIFPAPSTGVTDGIELIHSPIMSLGSDTEEPRIKIPAQEAILYAAKDLMLGETDESSQDTLRRYAEIIGDLPLWYSLDSDGGDRLQIELGVGI
jgi:hypothetical protein